MKQFKKGFQILLLLVLSISVSCEKDDDLNIIAGLDFVIATLNAEGNEVGVLPSTVPGDNRIVYTVDFGGVIEDEDNVQDTSGPMVTYSYPNETATYTITVTAALPGRDNVTISKEHTVIIVVPPAPATDDGPLVGTWRLAPESAAIGVGPAMDDVSWWSNTMDDVATRACLFDDTYVFNADGSFQNVLGADTWLEPWQGAAEGCGAPVSPHNGSVSATYSYNAAAGEITISGVGAFLGIAKAVNGEELASPADAPESIIYKALLVDANTLELDIEIGGGYWSFKLVKDAPPIASVLAGTWRLSPVSAAIGVGPAMDDVSWWSNTMDDVATRACLFDDTYVFGEDGSFQNMLGADTWLETWQGAASEGCGAPIAPHNGSSTATFTENLSLGSAGEITIDGVGSFLGIAKAFNGGELSTAGTTVPDSITYIAALSADGNTLDLDIEIGGGYWSFKLVKDNVPTTASAIEGTWKIASESAAIGVGPAMNDVSWWSNTTDDVATRACLFDDEYVFNADGSFQNVLGADTWLEDWQGVAEGCGAPVAPHDGSASATYTYNESAGEITINGTGAFLGIAKAFNGGELSTAGTTVPDSITYIAELSADGNTLDLDIEIGGGYWSFKLAKQ